MNDTRWLVELRLPGGIFEVRSVNTERTPEQFNADIHSSVADLLAWKPQAAIHSIPVTPMMQQDRALKIASDLRASSAECAINSRRSSCGTCCWSEDVRKAFDSYLEGVME